MATRSYIGRQYQDGSIDYIYCHWDGYPAYNGYILQEHYTDSDKVDQLLALGNLSSLAAEIGEKQDFNNRELQNENWCLAYGRDRGEKDAQASSAKDLEHLFSNATFIDYVYIFAGGEWKCYNSYGKDEIKIPKKECDEKLVD